MLEITGSRRACVCVYVCWSDLVVFFFSSLTQEGVKTENDHINLKVAGQDGSVVQFKIKRHTPLSKLMKAYCERQVSLFYLCATQWFSVVWQNTLSALIYLFCFYSVKLEAFKSPTLFLICVFPGSVDSSDTVQVWWTANKWNGHTCTGWWKLLLCRLLVYMRMSGSPAPCSEPSFQVLWTQNEATVIHGRKMLHWGFFYRNTNWNSAIRGSWSILVWLHESARVKWYWNFKVLNVSS